MDALELHRAWRLQISILAGVIRRNSEALKGLEEWVADMAETARVALSGPAVPDALWDIWSSSQNVLSDNHDVIYPEEACRMALVKILPQLTMVREVVDNFRMSNQHLDDVAFDAISVLVDDMVNEISKVVE